jgi:hypothetical protein
MRCGITFNSIFSIFLIGQSMGRMGIHATTPFSGRGKFDKERGRVR